MARIKVNGRYYDVDDVVLHIPGFCRVDFMTGVITKIPEDAAGKIEGRLIVLLNYLYHRDGYTSLDMIINDLYDGFAAEGTVKADINNLRKRLFDHKLENGDYQIIQNARGRGYRLVIPSVPDSTACTPAVFESTEEMPDDEEGTVVNTASYTRISRDRQTADVPPLNAILVQMQTGKIFPVCKSRIRIGSSDYREDMVDFVLADNTSINRVHAEIVCSGNSFFIREPRESGATQVDGHLLLQGETVQLGDCTELVLGNELFFFLSEPYSGHVIKDGRVFAVCSRETGETRLVLHDPLLMDRHHPWRQGIMKDPRISRTRQAKLYREDDKIRLVDTGSKNGTYYNRRCMVPGEPVVLNSGDCFSIVDTDFSYSEIALVQDTANTLGVE